MEALKQYEQKVDNFDRVEAIYQRDSFPILEQIEALVDELKNLSLHYEDEFGYEFDWREDIKNAIGV